MNEKIEKKLAELEIGPSDFTRIVEDDFVDQIEATIDTFLPKDYKGFLYRHSVGVMPSSYPMTEVKQNITQETIEVFYGRSSDPVYDLLANINAYRNRMPNSVIPIGSDACGNQICLGILGHARDKIYFWDFEQELVVVSEPDFSNMRLIANSFESFILSMHVLTFGR